MTEQDHHIFRWKYKGQPEGKFSSVVFFVIIKFNPHKNGFLIPSKGKNESYLFKLVLTKQLSKHRRSFSFYQSDGPIIFSGTTYLSKSSSLRTPSFNAASCIIIYTKTTLVINNQANKIYV